MRETEYPRCSDGFGQFSVQTCEMTSSVPGNGTSTVPVKKVVGRTAITDTVQIIRMIEPTAQI